MQGDVSPINPDEMSDILGVSEFQLRSAIVVIFDEPNWFSDYRTDRPLVLRR